LGVTAFLSSSRVTMICSQVFQEFFSMMMLYSIVFSPFLLNGCKDTSFSTNSQVVGFFRYV
jgi:hypothetical protein